MNIFSSFNFSLVIAYLLPGFFTVFSLRYISKYFNNLFILATAKDATLGASFLLILFSLVAGIILSAFRNTIIDPIYHKTKIPRPNIDYNKLDQTKLPVFKEAIDNTYRFYQFHANMFISFVVLIISRYVLFGQSILDGGIFFAILFVTGILFLNSRKSLRETYDVMSRIVGVVDNKK